MAELSTVALEVLTPRGVAAQVQAEEVVLPGSEGEFGVLPQHIPFLAALKEGTLRYRSGETWTTLPLKRGLAEVRADGRLSVLAVLAEPPPAS